MRFCISFVFFALLSCIAGQATCAAPMPTTLRLDLPGDMPTDFREDVLARMAEHPDWTIVLAPLPQPTPCDAASARASLQLHFVRTAARRLSLTADLFDCASWPVRSWSFERRDDRLGVAGLAGDLAFALRLWQHTEPSHFAALFDIGDANARQPGCKPGMSLVKTGDGRLRALVRAGGVAYRAGLRSNDVVERIDGRLWWEYGTYQAQQRAIDGTTHIYRLTDAQRDIKVACVQS